MSINFELEKKILNLIKSFNQNLFDEVIKDASALYKEINNLSVIPNLIGASYAGKNNHENAVIFYKKALAIEHNNTEILNNLAKSFSAINLYDEAIDTLEKSIILDEKNYDTYFNLGIINFNKGDYKESLKNYKYAIKLNNQIDKIYYNMAITFSKNGNVSIGGTFEIFPTSGIANQNYSEFKLSTFSIGQHNNVGTMKIMNNNATGTLIIGAGGGGGYGGISLFNKNLNARYLQAHNEGAVDLYYNGTKRFETTNTGAIVTGILTATSLNGSLAASNLTGALPALDGSNLTGIVGGKFNGPVAGILTTSTVGIQTADVTSADLVGAATSMVGLYIGDGHLLFSNYLNKSGGYYITTGLNALNAGPVTLGSTMTLDGTWVIV